jgi:uncharacterized membrane-anchored protein YjiN (DUF445 family)
VNAGEAELARRLERMQWLATGLLALMAILFILTSLWRDNSPALELVWAFSEAALIGGLADWFAVTALFRHPLGLPIPHTAIVPNRKDEIGRSLAKFIAEHFLVRDVLERELGRLDLAGGLGRWLQQPQNAASLGDDTARALTWVLDDTASGPLREATVRSLADMARSLPARQLLAALIDVLAAGPHTQTLIDNLVRFAYEQLDRNKPLIRERIRERSPWWLPRFVDEEIFDQLVSEIERILGEIATDPEHPARQTLLDRLRRTQALIVDDTEFNTGSDKLGEEFLKHPAVVDFGRDLARHMHAFLCEALDDTGSDLRRGLEREFARVGQKLAADPALARRLDSWMTEIVVYLVETYRTPISSIVSTTIASWDPQSTSRRIELQIGRDLQFIRINGTLVGGFVGLLLYLSWTTTVG